MKAPEQIMNEAVEAINSLLNAHREGWEYEPGYPYLAMALQTIAEEMRVPCRGNYSVQGWCHKCNTVIFDNEAWQVDVSLRNVHDRCI